MIFSIFHHGSGVGTIVYRADRGEIANEVVQDEKNILTKLSPV
jgi:hypothetical protein